MGTPPGLIEDGVVQEVDIKTGLVMFQWDALGHVPISDTHTTITASPSSGLDYFHITSIDLPPSGDLLISARPKQWIKNGFVFAALIFASKLGKPDLVARAVVAFVLFSLLSGSIYLLNDAADAEADRGHPLDAHRRGLRRIAARRPDGA